LTITAFQQACNRAFTLPPNFFIQINKLLGAIPPDLDETLSKMSVAQLETLADKIIEIKSLEDLRRAIALNY